MSQPKGLLDAANLHIIKDSISSIKKNAMQFLSGTALSRVSGLVRDMVLAYAFGTNEAIAALFVAFRLSHVCRRLFGEGALQSAFIPVFEELRNETPQRAFSFFRDLSVLLTLFLIAFVTLTMVGLGLSFSFIDWSPGNKEIVFLMIILMPSLIPICLFGINSALLQCQKHYFTAGIAPAFFNIIITVGALLLQGFTPTNAMPYLAISIVIACAAQWFVSFLPAIRHLKNHLGFRVFASLHLFSKDIKRLGRPLALGLLGVGASQINNAVDSLFGRYADVEGPAQLWYGLRLMQLPLALFGIAISGALLPPLSRAVQAGKKEEYLGFLNFALRRVSALLIPCTVILIALGTPLMNLIYGRGDFQAHSIYTSTSCLHGYALGLLPMGFIIVLAPAFYAHKDFRTPTIGAIISLVANLLLNVIMVFLLNWKAVSVALATSISSWMNVLFLFAYLEIHTGHIFNEQGLKESFKVVAISLAAAVITFLSQYFFMIPASFFTLFTNNADQLPTTTYDQSIAFAIPMFIFIGCLALFAKITHAEDLISLFRRQKKEPSPLQ